MLNFIRKYQRGLMDIKATEQNKMILMKVNPLSGRGVLKWKDWKSTAHGLTLILHLFLDSL